LFRDQQGRVQRVGAYAICIDNESGNEPLLLMCRLTAETGRPGWWTIPGGGLDFGEAPRDAVVREAREETGYEIRVGELLAVDSLARDAYVEGETVPYHAVRVVFRAEIIGGSLTHEASGSTDRAAWFTREEIQPLQLNELTELAVALAFGA
jgi:8-oxo-dGTP diphosphatase